MFVQAPKCGGRQAFERIRNAPEECGHACLLAIQFCQQYQIYDDIRSLEYHEGEQMIQLNGEDLYYLG